jgi:hypothetical protein
MTTVDFNEEGFTLGQIVSIISALSIGALATMIIMSHPIAGIVLLLMAISIAFMNGKFFLTKIMKYKVIDYFEKK